MKIIVPLMALAAVAAATSKPKRKKLPSLPAPGDDPDLPPPPDKPEEYRVIWDQESWYMPEGWLEHYATPMLGDLVESAHAAGEEIDPLAVTYSLLQGQTAGFVLPPAPRPPEGDFWQVTVPIAPNYYEGPDSVLGLFYHVNAYVEEALGRWVAGDELYMVDFD